MLPVLGSACTDIAGSCMIYNIPLENSTQCLLNIIGWKCKASMQGGGTGGLAFFDTIYKAATLPASWSAPQRDLHYNTTASPPNQGGLVATVSDLHHEQHTARPELYAPKVRQGCYALALPVCGFGLLTYCMMIVWKFVST